MTSDPTVFQTVWVFVLVWVALGVSGIWEAYVEGRNAWDRGKLGWRIRIGSFLLTGYHFFLFWVMYPALLAIPFVFTGWNVKLFGIMLSAYATGMVIEDFVWYLVNPAVALRELYSPFSDYYPWIRFNGRKILPAGYVVGVLVALLSWYFLWK